MDYTIKKQNCSICETILEATAEQPVDLDFSLPDYCPDIERILKCRICPSVTSKNITGSSLEVEGMTVIRLYYLDSKKQAIRLCEHSTPFSCSFELKTTRPDMISRVRWKTEYLNCRAVSPRRLDIHGAFSIMASVWAAGTREYCSMVEGEDIQQQTHTEPMSQLTGMGQQQFTISEVLDIGQGKASPESILRSELIFHRGDCRAINDKLMLKGEAVLKILYVTDLESGAQDQMSFQIPVSQIIDVQGITETTVNDISVDLMNYDVSLKSEFDESSTLVTLDARLTATVFAYDEGEAGFIDDAYSTAYELEPVYRQLPVTRLTACPEMKIAVKTEMNTGDMTIAKVIDLWAETLHTICTVENAKPVIKGKVSCCVLAQDSSGIPFFVEKSADFSASAECPPFSGEAEMKASVQVSGISFHITGDHTIELKADLFVQCAVYEKRSCRCLTEARATEDKIREKDASAALTLYYADSGESLWDIARIYCTSVEAIKLENNMTEEIIHDRGMILIPM